MWESCGDLSINLRSCLSSVWVSRFLYLCKIFVFVDILICVYVFYMPRHLMYVWLSCRHKNPNVQLYPIWEAPFRMCGLSFVCKHILSCSYIVSLFIFCRRIYMRDVQRYLLPVQVSHRQGYNLFVQLSLICVATCLRYSWHLEL